MWAALRLIIKDDAATSGFGVTRRWPSRIQLEMLYKNLKTFTSHARKCELNTVARCWTGSWKKKCWTVIQNGGPKTCIFVSRPSLPAMQSIGWAWATRKKDYFHSSHSSGKSEEGLRRMQRITIRWPVGCASFHSVFSGCTSPQKYGHCCPSTG